MTRVTTAAFAAAFLLVAPGLVHAETLRREIEIDATPDHVWDAVRDFGAVHTRVAPGFINSLRLEGDARVVTFSNGSSARELLVDVDDEARRIAYAIAGNGRITSYSASVQVFAKGARHSRLVWTIDLLPNALAGYVGPQMDLAIPIMKRTLEASPR